MDGKLALLLAALITVLWLSPVVRWRVKQLAVGLAAVALAGMIILDLGSRTLG